jgi:glucokinase
MKSIAVGIDIGGTNSGFGLVDREGNILSEGSIPTTRHEKIADYVAALHQGIQALIDDLGEEVELKGIGIGAPNANYKRGTIEHAPNLRWKGIVPLAELFRAHYPDIPVLVTNDANAAAIGEQVFGAAKGVDDFVVITLGTGVGSGFMVGGKLLYGHDGFAGEFGHVTAVRGGRLCTCGRRGCVETYAAARGLVLTVQEELAASQDESELRHVLPEEITPKRIFDAAENGDPIAKRAFEQTGKILGENLANLVAITSPAVIYFFGGVAQAGDYIFKPTKRHMEANLLTIFKDKIKIMASGLPDNDAAILGSSALVWKELELEELGNREIRQG